MATKAKALAPSDPYAIDPDDDEYENIEGEPDNAAEPEDVEDDDEPAIPDDLVFTSDVEEQPEREELWFSADGIRLRALNPAPFTWTLILAGFANVATDSDRAQATLQFIKAALDDRSWMTVYNRAISGEMSNEMLGEIIAALISRWAPAESKKEAAQALAKVRGTNRAQRRAKRKR